MNSFKKFIRNFSQSFCMNSFNKRKRECAQFNRMHTLIALMLCVSFVALVGCSTQTDVSQSGAKNAPQPQGEAQQLSMIIKELSAPQADASPTPETTVALAEPPAPLESPVETATSTSDNPTTEPPAQSASPLVELKYKPDDFVFDKAAWGMDYKTLTYYEGYVPQLSDDVGSYCEYTRPFFSDTPENGTVRFYFNSDGAMDFIVYSFPVDIKDDLPIVASIKVESLLNDLIAKYGQYAAQSTLLPASAWIQTPAPSESQSPSSSQLPSDARDMQQDSPEVTETLVPTETPAAEVSEQPQPTTTPTEPQTTPFPASGWAAAMLNGGSNTVYFYADKAEVAARFAQVENDMPGVVVCLQAPGGKRISMPVPKAQDQYVTADLIGRYENNEISAEYYITSRFIEVRGLVARIARDNDGRPVVTLSIPNQDQSVVSCIFEERSIRELLPLNKGDTINIVGQCKGRTDSGVELVHCRIVN